jgi:protein O-GlcNAc transferase
MEIEKKIIQLYEEGKLADAIKICEILLNKKKNYEIYRLLSIFLLEQKNYSSALEAINSGIKINKNNKFLYVIKGNILCETLKYEEAIKNYKQAILLDKKYISPYFNLGNLYRKINEIEISINNYLKCIEIDQKYIDAYLNIGAIYENDQNYEEAIKYYTKCLSIDKNYINAKCNLANVYKSLKENKIATKLYMECIDLDPKHKESRTNLAVLMISENRTIEAINILKDVLVIDVNFIEAYINIGVAYAKINKNNDALNALYYALKIDKRRVEIYINIAQIYIQQFDFNKALEFYRLAYEIEPLYQNLLSSYIMTKIRVCDYDEIDKYLDELMINFKKNKLKINPFLSISIINNQSINTLIANKWSSNQGLKEKFHKKNIKYDNNKIKIGYFSYDLRKHPVGYLINELIELHNRDSFEVHAFYYGPKTNDDIQLKLIKDFDKFIFIEDYSDEEIALKAKTYQIDIAIDLGGYTMHSRPEIFDFNPAPIKMYFLGYLGVMGGTSFDYMIADKILVKEEEVDNLGIKIAYLNNYQPPSKIDIIVKNDIIYQENKDFIFGSFNNNFKLNTYILGIWVNILNKVLNSKLLIYIESRESEYNLKKFFSKNLIKEDRIIYFKKLEKLNYLKLMSGVNLMLDSFPYNGGTTTSDSLNMNVPVLTLYGNTISSRMSSSILKFYMLEELIVYNSMEYENMAVELFNDRNKYNQIKNKIIKKNLEKEINSMEKYVLNFEEMLIECYNKER